MPTIRIRGSHAARRDNPALRVSDHLAKKVALRRCGERRLLSRIDYPNGGHDLLFFVPSRILNPLETVFSNDRYETQMPAFLNTAIETYQKLVETSERAAGFEKNALNPVVGVIPFALGDGNVRRLRDLLVGIRLGEGDFPKFLGGTLLDFRESLLQGYLTRMKRDLQNDFFDAGERLEILSSGKKLNQATANSVSDGYHAHIYIPFDHLHPSLQTIYFDEITAVQKPAPAAQQYVELRDETTGKELQARYYKTRPKASFESTLRQRIASLLEISINNFIRSYGDRMPDFTPQPRLDICLDFGDATQVGRDFPNGVGITILFKTQGFKDAELRESIGETIKFARARREALANSPRE